MLPIGAAPAALAANPAAERLGRKGALLASNGLAVIGGALMGGAKLGPPHVLIILGRLVVGVYSGLASGLVPMYLEEVAPPRLRGAMGAMHEVGVALGMLVSQVLGLGALLGTERAWPALLALGLLPAALQLLLLPLCPESPRFLLERGDVARARRDAAWLEGAWPEGAELAGPAPRVGLAQLWGRAELRQPLLLTVGLALVQQLSGIAALFYYSTAIFERAGLAQPACATVGTGAANMAATLLSVALLRRAGRRAMMLSGLLGMAASGALVTLGLSLRGPWPLPPALAVGGALLLAASFALGPGAVPRLLPAELLPPPPRAAAAAIASATAWAANGAAAAALPAMQLSLGPFLLLPFGAVSAVSALGVFLLLPETRGRAWSPPPAPPPKPGTELQLLAGT